MQMNTEYRHSTRIVVKLKNIIFTSIMIYTPVSIVFLTFDKICWLLQETIEFKTFKSSKYPLETIIKVTR